MSDEHVGSPLNVEVLSAGKSFTEMWAGLSDSQREWLRHKAQWEHMTLSAVVAEWGVPSDQQAKALLGEGRGNS